MDIMLLKVRWDRVRELYLLNVGFTIKRLDFYWIDRSLLAFEFIDGTFIKADLLFFRWYSDAGPFAFFRELLEANND